MKVFNAFFGLYRTLLYIAVTLFLLVTIGPMAVGIRPFVVQSASMEPVIMTGSLVYIQQEESKSPLAKYLEYKEPEVKDIVAFKQGSGDNAITVVHRVHEMDPSGKFIMKGDNNESTDIAMINRNQIIGQYKFSIPKLGYFVATLTSKKGIIVAVVLMVIAFFSSFIADGADNNDEEEEQEAEEVKKKEKKKKKTNNTDKDIKEVKEEVKPTTENEETPSGSFEFDELLDDITQSTPEVVEADVFNSEDMQMLKEFENIINIAKTSICPRG